MKKIVFIITIMAFVILALYIMLSAITKKAGKDINSFYKPMQEQAKQITSFNDVDFSTGDYALYINHPQEGEFLVSNPKLLAANQKNLSVKVSWVNFLPGEGYRSYGAILFKNNQAIFSKTGGVFKDFEIGALKKGAIPVKKHRLHLVKTALQKHIDRLAKNKNAYIIHQSNLPKTDKEFHFRIYFPSIALPITKALDQEGYERIQSINFIPKKDWDRGNDGGFDAEITQQLTECIRAKAGGNLDYDIAISNGTQTGAYLYNTKTGLELKDSNKHMLYLDNFMYVNYEAYIGANKATAEQLLALDYTDCLGDFVRNKEGVISAINQTIKTSNSPNLSLEKGQVGLSGYKDKTSKYKNLYEQEYSLSWLEIEAQ